jgi:membrane protein involved in colicin uptake
MTTAVTEIIEAPAINVKCVSEYEGKAIELTKSIASLVIRDQETYETAVNYRKTLKKIDAEVEASRKTIVNPLNQVKDAVQALFNPIKLRIDNSRRHVEGLIDAYEQEQERKRLEEENRLRKIAEAEEARQRKIKEEQERQWREKEAKARAEQERLEKEIANAKNEKAKAEFEVAQAKAKAEQEKAARLAEERRQQAEEIFVPAPVIAPTLQKIEGTSIRENWSAEVVDLLALIKAVADGKAPITWLKIDQVAINKQATATKNSLQFPGIRFIVKRTQVDR